MTMSEPVTVYGIGVRAHFSDAGTLVPGAVLFLSGTAGELDDAASVADTVGLVQAVTVNDIRLVRAI